MLGRAKVGMVYALQEKLELMYNTRVFAKLFGGSLIIHLQG